MEIVFKTKKLANILNSRKELFKEYGKANGKVIMRRMSVLAAAPSLASVPHQRPERCHKLTGDRQGQFAVDAKHPFRIVFRPTQEPPPRHEDGGLNLSEITAITILAVEDYHR